MEYDMEPFLDSCVERYCELAKIPRSSLKWVKTPFIDEREAMKQEKEALHHNEEIEEHLAGASAKQNSGCFVFDRFKSADESVVCRTIG